jgi:fructose/tagatose bisphosphate aldolase
LIKYVRPLNISVEAEVGHMAQAEELEKGTFKSDIGEIKEFIGKVDVDLLAISVGTSHGEYELQDEIDMV